MDETYRFFLLFLVFFHYDPLLTISLDKPVYFALPEIQKGLDIIADAKNIIAA